MCGAREDGVSYHDADKSHVPDRTPTVELGARGAAISAAEERAEDAEKAAAAALEAAAAYDDAADDEADSVVTMESQPTRDVS